LVIPSTIDGTLAPRGQHVASLFCQHVAPKLSDGSSWDDHRETVADLMIETVNDHEPNFRRSVLAGQIFSPLDLERTFGLIGGDIFHRALDLRQIFSARPMLGYADFRGPIERRDAWSASSFECFDDDHAAATAWFGLASARPTRQFQPGNLLIGWISA
jgi:phytoene dehydrogenase-like protein